ncbi:DUF2509 family protein [Pantoea sp. MBD-2R]|uniref:DUF2509 family protein n=1 Tax=Pantoea sp. MBD-2R TaxID=3141540 RepID=UPI0031838C49
MNSRQQGSGALIAVIILLLMSAMLLNATRQQAEDALSLVADERIWFQQASLAESALNWGRQRQWPEGEAGWQCQIESFFRWRACLLIEQERVLLKGDSGAGTLAFYQWVSRVTGTGKLLAQPHGWLDYCPYTEEKRCFSDE